MPVNWLVMVGFELALIGVDDRHDESGTDRDQPVIAVTASQAHTSAG